jgi:RecA/RadA recombinase
VKKIAEVKGISDAKVEKILAAATQICPVSGWTNALSLSHKRQKSVVRITTGSKEVDAILGGGFETACITEMYGEYRTGKTQLCMTACVTTQLPVEEGELHCIELKLFAGTIHTLEVVLLTLGGCDALAALEANLS